MGAAGPAGPAGPAGAAGAAGAVGAAGPTVASTRHIVSSLANALPVSGTNAISVTCPTGEVAVGGGFSVSSAVAVTTSAPDAVNPRTWDVTLQTTTTTETADIYAVCIA